MKPVAVRVGGRRLDGRGPPGREPVPVSFDHRAFDGAYAAAFLARVRDILETRDWAQEV